ncbi:phosphodiesterase [Stenotrophomonas humi]|uniref:Phosphodiesterase n=1 Tax=Stenotrophomonas humi TaxID=405444 RepID=A0A0R0CAY0_9GAMM|nr:ectonucleotide pyrophosphatase/phosphodiesterase [Stenotrophomonas humi]KRG63057.1 phosphodiesterase [Stenotrophomonas humi]
MISIRFPIAALSCALLAACASSPAPVAPSPTPPTVLLLSIDGLRADMLDSGNSPNLSRLAREGVRSVGMRPSYPSLTFPNHYTLVTGLRPDRHGMVHNSMNTDALGNFRVESREAVRNPAWWEGGEPLWVSVEKAGYKSATWSWPGSEAPIHGLQAQQRHPYDDSVPLPERMQQVLSWLEGTPDAIKPRFVAAYMEHVDKAGHRYGPDSPEYTAALRQVDAAIGLLIDGMAADGSLDNTNIIVVSDHGMATVKQDQVITPADMIAPELARTVSVGQSIGFAPLPGKHAEAEKALLGRHAHYQCWNKAQLPTRWHYGHNPRVPPIICQMDEGWDAVTPAMRAKRAPGNSGSHGYDPALPSMQAVFVARGPAFAQGKQLSAFDNVDVYPLLTRLIGIPAQPNDGDPKALEQALRVSDM